MTELLNAFDDNLDFNREAYFTLSFDALPSALYLDVPMEDSKPNMEKALDLMKLSESEFELVYKVWDTEDSSNADFEKDYPYQQLYKSNSHKGLVWVTLSNETLAVDFLYDCKDSAYENWVLDMNDQLRKQFGLSRAPNFNILTKPHNCFTTKEVRIEKIELDLIHNYNDDFIAIHQEIEKAILYKQSGLILLYGTPGTGKTTYIRSLMSKYQDSNFIFVQNEFVPRLLDPDFIAFLLKQRNAILVIEDAEKVICSRENSNGGSVVSTILQLTDGLFSDYLNIKVVCTFNTSLSKIDSALMRKGRLIAMYEFNQLSIRKTNDLLNAIGGEASNVEMTVADIYNKEQKEFANLEKGRIGF